MSVTTFACRRHPEATWQAPWRRVFGLIGQRQISLEVLVAVGVLRWGLNLQRDEVVRELAPRGLRLSHGQVSRLGDEFLVRWHQWFDAHVSRWARRWRRGLILLIDGTQDGGGPVTYRAISHRQGVTVHAATIRSENEQDLVAFLEEVKRRVGRPALIVRDGSQAARNACTRVFPGVPQRLCHWHWLKDAGQPLLEDAYRELREAVLEEKRLPALEKLRGKLVEAGPEADSARRRSLRVWTRLLLEDIVSARDATGGFPFRLAYYDVMRRVRDGRRRAKAMIDAALKWNVHEPLLVEARQRLDALGEDARVKKAFLSVDRRVAWFTRLRAALRLEDAQSGTPQDATAAALEADQVLAKVQEIRGEAEAAGLGEASAWMRVVTRYRDHEAELFPTVRLKDAPRTTALMEASHRRDRRSCRRRTGTLATRSVMERLGDHLAVWSNASNRWMVRHAFHGVDLVAAFLDQDPAHVEAGLAALRAKRWRDRLPVRAKERAPLLDEFLNLATPNAPDVILTHWADRVEGLASPEV